MSLAANVLRGQHEIGSLAVPIEQNGSAFIKLLAGDCLSVEDTVALMNMTVIELCAIDFID
jgi:hypothetical protein